jgi:transketolase
MEEAKDLRDAFFDRVYEIAKNDPDVMLLTADMGAHSLEVFKKDLPAQYINVGVAEQNMVSVAAGLSLGGKKVFIYSIAPFVTLRCYEQIKIDLCCMNLGVTIVGVGSGLSYGSDGPTHHATQDIAAMRALPEISILNPSDVLCAEWAAEFGYKSSSPVYVRVDRGNLARLYKKEEGFKDGFAGIRPGKDVAIVSTGVMTHTAVTVSDMLKRRSLSAAVIDLYRIKPLNKKSLLEYIAGAKAVVTLEENNLTGGIGSAVSEALKDERIDKPLRRIAIPDEHCFKCGTREELHKLYGLDAEGIAKSISDWRY